METITWEEIHKMDKLPYKELSDEKRSWLALAKAIPLELAVAIINDFDSDRVSKFDAKCLSEIAEALNNKYGNIDTGLFIWVISSVGPQAKNIMDFIAGRIKDKG